MADEIDVYVFETTLNRWESRERCFDVSMYLRWLTTSARARPSSHVDADLWLHKLVGDQPLSRERKYPLPLSFPAIQWIPVVYSRDI